MIRQPILRFIFAVTFCGLNTFTQAATLSLSNVPLFLGGAIEPNIMFTLDDSGSMQWDVMPDENKFFANYIFPSPNGVYGDSRYVNQVPNFNDNNVHNYFLRSSANNTIFYNPNITYSPWSNANGSSMADANPRQAYYNPFNTGAGSMDLLSEQRQFACWYQSNNLNQAFGAPCYGNYDFWPITYYIYDGSGSRTDRDNYERIQITSSTPASTTFVSPSGISRSRNEEIQNFANWFQYYRSRILTTRAGIGRAFGKQGGNLRLGFAAINKGDDKIDGEDSDGAIVRGLRPFTGTNRDNFFDELYGRTIPTLGTPLRNATKYVGEYFERDDDRGPWSKTPGTTNNADHLSCRQSYHILMTDGYWNGGNPGVGNADNNNGQVISGPDNDDYQYTPARPYLDNWSNTLADVAMDYWKRDLRPDLENDVPNNTEDPGFWQHMVNFTVGLGVIGTLNPETDLPALSSGALNWPQPAPNIEENIDDLWHAAVNSRGAFFSATDPDEFANALSSILSKVSDRTSSASSVALNSGTVADDSRIYQARFDSGDWSGQLLAFDVENNGELSGIAWDAAQQIPKPGQRIIITSDGQAGQRFRWNKLNNSQKTLLGNKDIFRYIRGNAKDEIINGGSFRNRSSRLGDIINSAPAYHGAPSARYLDNWGTGAAENANPYSTFKADNLGRTPLIFVGANDGMLHAFNASNGSEAFAYVPNAIMSQLPDLTDPAYTHKYFVDGSPTIVDAYVNGQWRSILVSGLNAGGQGVFALDVTDPADFANEASAAGQVLWEFTDRDDADLGFTFGDPSIVRLKNGTWAAVFSGGYNNTFDNDADGTSTNDSTNGDAVLYLVNLATGALIKKFSTQTGADEDPTGGNRPNGLATPSVVDIDGDQIADLIYAGDLFGNMWKIDISDNNTNNWDFDYKQGSKPLPIFTACAGASCNGGNLQPITTRPIIVNHPTSSGYLVLFGTGKYLEVGDNSSSAQVTQSFYGIWDRNANSLAAFDRSDLLQQNILFEQEQNNFEYRITTDNKINWNSNSGWYLDLVSPVTATNQGERQISEAIVRNGRVIFTTLLPSDNPCDFGGDSWLMELNLNSGSRLDFTPFDINDDGLFTSADFIDINLGDIDGDGNDDFISAPVSGRKSKVGISSTPAIMDDGSGQAEFKYLSGSDGNIEMVEENPGPGFEGRQSWRQLDFLFR